MHTTEALRENSTEEIVLRYKADVMQMARYLPWLKEHAGKGSSVQNTYSNESMDHTIPFPVYDSTLLSFVREYQRTGLSDRNYAYVYTRNRLKSSTDELKFIDRADIKELDDLKGIISRYVIEGNVRGIMWSEGINNGVIYSALLRMKEIIEFWGKEPKGHGR